MHRRLLAPLLFLLFLLLATMAPTAVAGELTPSESAALRQDVQGMLAAFADCWASVRSGASIYAWHGSTGCPLAEQRVQRGPGSRLLQPIETPLLHDRLCRLYQPTPCRTRKRTA